MTQRDVDFLRVIDRLLEPTNHALDYRLAEQRRIQPNPAPIGVDEEDYRDGGLP